ncbi:putative major outer membrane protein P44-20 [Anaplasma phagocytophilum str. ApMUC09]|uniref:Putative major outer membrane protein P44-20 n=1 Tax=Anaplasma phagocytophilum str. ApMUC09 TaxID=1359152 RepID=A0A0F3N8N3_ANAPH|nr:putative major outer membrane protein P44-20 [Anaplasma phagocytophilum str. ApMUC09]
MEISSPKINGEVCKLTGSKRYGKESEAGGLTCGEGSTGDSSGSAQNGAFKEFRGYVLEVGGHKHWPTTQGTTDKGKDNAAKVAQGLVALNRDEKTIVAGLLAKTIEGGEVVEIRAVSSTSVMVNSSGYTKLRHMM